MGNMVPTTIAFNLPSGQEVIIETGKLATQAHGSVVVRIGKTMIFASVVSAHEPRENPQFFPLSVDYQEKFASAGRIPGNFFRREARLSDYEILICRLVDRAVRPLFPDGYMNDTQIIINLISGDEETLPDSYAALAASAALAVSDIPFAGPISEVRVGKINGEYIVNPTRSQMEEASMDIIVAATIDNVMMVEGEMNEAQEEELLEAIQVGHDHIKVQCQAQLDLADKVGEKATVKRVIEPKVIDEELMSKIESLTKEGILKVSRGKLDKMKRKEGFKEVKTGLKEALLEEMGEEYMEENSKKIGEYYYKFQKETIRRMMLDENTRLDGRAMDQVRPIWTEVDYLPSAHGSAIFNRGETQALMSLTLGTKMDQQRIENALNQYQDNFLLHYNFPALSVGEIKPMRGPGRREVGHANLAGRSIKKVMPQDLPYTIRLVSDILESNGSSSMATVCAGSLALMDGGIQLSAPISGIAMGLVTDGAKTAVLSDILGDEDSLGDMDFKVTGTKAGICACQMDIKVDGLPYETLQAALAQAKAGRIHILDEMNKTLSSSNADLKPHAPRMEKIVIDKSYIGAVIGPGGKIIQELQERTGTTITIEEVNGQGEVYISSTDAEGLNEAKAAINAIAYTPEVGDVLEAKIAKIMPYGAFVDFTGKSGLLHISEVSHTRIENLEDVMAVGDVMKIKIIGIDPKTGKFKLSRKVLISNPRDTANSN